MAKITSVKVDTEVEGINENIDDQIDEIKSFFNDPKTKKESSKLKHCIKYVLAEIASDEEELQDAERQRIASEKGPDLLEFLFGKKN